MKTKLQRLIKKSSITRIFLLFTLTVFILTPTRAFSANSAVESFLLSMTNIKQTAANKIEFDIYLLDTDPAQQFQWAGGQFWIWMNTLMFNGGTITVTYSNTNSGVLATQQFNSNPNTATTSGTQTLLKLAGRTPPGAGNGSFIPSTSPGALITHFTIAGSVNFLAGSTPDFAFANATYPTVVAEYISNVNTVLTLIPGTPATPGANAVVNSNPVLNVAPTAYNVTGSGSYCQGTGGQAVGLSSSEVGITYTLYNGTTALTPTVAGTGAAISFGNQLAGTYTVQGTNFGGTTTMTGSAILTENPSLTAGVSIAAGANNICSGTSVTYTATPTNGGTSPSYQWYNGTTAVGTNSATYTYAPANGDVIKVVMTSNATPCLVGSPVTSNTVTMVVNPNLTAGVSIAAGANNICSGTSVTFTATPTNGGSSPSYQWYNGTTAVGTNSATYTYAPANGDVIKVVMTSNATPCLVGSPVTSNTVTMVVNPNLTAGVSIAAGANNICSGTSVTFTATPTNGGSSPSYQWYKGTTAVGTNSATYTYAPANGDVIKVVMTSNATPCLVGSPVTSNTVTMVVNPNLTAGVSIAAGANNICSGTSVTFTATPTNGGTSPSYQWYNGTTAVGTNSATYTYAPANGDVIKVVMTSNATPCLVGSPVTSNTVTMVVNPNLTAGVSIAAGANNVCSGTSVTFTATPTNGGSSPSYQWYNGTTAVGTNSATYTYAPANGDVIKVVMTSNATPCLVGSPVTSNTVTMVVNPNLTAGVSIAAGANNVCSGTSVTYTATPTNGGTSPSYQWYNGTTAVGTNSATYTYAPANGDVIKVVMTSNATPCLVASPVTSNTVTMVVNEAPITTTVFANSISSAEATLNGTINANSISTTVTFEYGLTTSYGTTVTATQSPVTGTTTSAVSYVLTGLVPNTTYHFRVNGVNAGGTTNGADLTFTTTIGTGLNGNGNQQITLYPNPATDAFRMQGLNGVSSITLIDISGRTVLQQQVLENESVSVSTLQTGVYILKIKNNEGTIERKVVKK